MKISLITIHDIGNNYGSTLQSCALYRYIRKLGYEVECVDYQPRYRSLGGEIKYFVVNLIFFVDYLRREKRFKTYYRSYMQLTRRYNCYRDLCNNPPQADVYMVGSDQVWNLNYPCGQDEAYYLKYTDSPNKISYASSLGCSFSLEDICILKEKIKDFCCISVREYFSSKQLMNASVDAQYVMDPVFLLSKEEYLQEVIKPPCENYLLVYAVNEDPFLDSVAQQIALERNLKIVLIGGFAKKIKCDIFYRSVGPKEFLSLINYAEFILISSFHGIAFSLVLNKQFAVIQPRVSVLRITDILSSAGLTNRIIKNFADVVVHKDFIDYIIVNEKLKILIEKSKQYLIYNLQNLKNRIERRGK